VRNTARVEGCIAEAFTYKEIMNFLSKYFSRANNVNAHMTRYHKTYWKRSGQPTLKQLDSMRQHGVKGGPNFLKWFRLHVIFPFTHFFISSCHSSITCI
jgi:hypothetical protein